MAKTTRRSYKGSGFSKNLARRRIRKAELAFSKQRKRTWGY